MKFNINRPMVAVVNLPKESGEFMNTLIFFLTNLFSVSESKISAR